MLVTPTSPTVAFPLGEKAADPLAMYLSDLLTIPSCLAGLPGLIDPVRPLRRAPGRPPADRAAVRREHALPRRPRARAALGFDSSERLDEDVPDPPPIPMSASFAAGRAVAAMPSGRPGDPGGRAASRPGVLEDGSPWSRSWATSSAVREPKGGARWRTSRLGARDRPRDPRPAEDADEDVLPLRGRLGAEPEHAHLPGLPRLTRARCRCRTARAIEWTIKLGLALGCEIADRAVFHRKNYFYPDLPKGYQISQYDEPLCSTAAARARRPTATSRSGSCARTSRRTRRRPSTSAAHGGRIGGAAHSLVDFNRGGTPLVEIVTQPDIHSADEAKRFLQLLRQTIVELGISDAEMEKGTLRVDANVSVRPAGSDELRTRTEIKNMNSFTHIARGIEAEVARQVAVWESGGEVEQQTYDFDVATGRLTPRRSKEEADDYRYFPEPDLVPVEPPADSSSGCGPSCRSCRARGSAGSRRGRLDLDRALVLVTGGRDASGGVAAPGGRRRAVANVVMNQLVGAGVDPAGVDAASSAKLIAARDRIPRAAFDEALASAGEPGFAAEPYLAQEAVIDVGELEPLVDAGARGERGQVAAYRAGKEGLLGFFVGQVMKRPAARPTPRSSTSCCARSCALEANGLPPGGPGSAVRHRPVVPSLRKGFTWIRGSGS